MDAAESDLFNEKVGKQHPRGRKRMELGIESFIFPREFCLKLSDNDLS